MTVNARVARSGTWLLLSALVLALWTVPSPSAEGQTTADVGHRAQAYTSTAGPVTGEKPESKLWFHAGRWWATMIPDGGTTHTIHELRGTTWTDTGVVVAGSADARGDALMVDDRLYISNRGTSTLFRATWNGATQTWVPHPGGAVQLPIPPVTPALTIARDTTGRLWLTWLEADHIRVAVATESATMTRASWSVLDLTNIAGIGSAAETGDDDMGAVISFRDATGPAIGVMWSNQSQRRQFFAVHRDGAGTGTWSLETIGEGVTREADDHINLRTHNGSVYAAIKTEHTFRSPDRSLIRLLVRSPSGAWRGNVVAELDERDTRPIAALEVASGHVYVFMTRNPIGDQRHIVYKRAPLSEVRPGSAVARAFDEPAVTFIRSGAGQGINDPTSAKSVATSASGIVVLASSRNHYWWNRLDVTAPAPASFTLATGVVGQGRVTRSPSGDRYSDGTRVTLTATAARGWRFSHWSGGLTGTANPAYPIMDRDRTVTATFVEDPTWQGWPPHGFPDVAASAHYAEAVAWLKAVEITGGFPDGTFGPNRTVTRGQMASFLFRLMDRPTGFPSHGFPDVPRGAHYDVPLRWLSEAGIAGGFSDGTFGPGRDVTRGQMASFLHRLVGSPDGYAAHGLRDVPANAHYAAAVRWLAGEGITTGFSDGTYRPAEPITRGQMASLLYRLASTSSAWHDTPMPSTAP